MDDLLTRLRTQGEWYSEGNGPLHKEAADEIVRLTETIRAFGRGDIVPITDKDAENERLRAALKTVQTFIAGEQIAHALVPEGDGGPDTWPTLAKVIARAFEQSTRGGSK